MVQYNESRRFFGSAIRLHAVVMLEISFLDAQFQRSDVGSSQPPSYTLSYADLHSMMVMTSYILKASHFTVMDWAMPDKARESINKIPHFKNFLMFVVGN